MAAVKRAAEPVTLILGAGASRAAQYTKPRLPSPLDRDFFDLLQRLKPTYKSKHLQCKLEEARDFVVEKSLNLEHGRFVDSMERLFYTLHQNAIIHHQLFPREFSTNPDDELREKFTIAIQGVLRAAHGTSICSHHVKLFGPLRGTDGIVTFNYDLVAERALRKLHGDKNEFGLWLYGIHGERRDRPDLPTLHKLHGSVNWKLLEDEEVHPTQGSWSDFDREPGCKGFNILLPYWEKRVEKQPWKAIWRKAAQQLRRTVRLMVWGYSLPLTDLKARELLRVGLAARGRSTVFQAAA